MTPKPAVFMLGHVDGTVGVPGTGLSYRERLSNRGCASLLVISGGAAFGVGAWWLAAA